MISQVDVVDLQQNLESWLARARVGEEVAIVERGSVVARLMPPADLRADARRELEALRANARVGDVESPLGEAWDAGNDPP